MKRYLTLLLTFSVILSLFAGCGKQEQEEAYVPTGDALIMSDDDLATIEPEKETQDLTLAYDPSRTMNPLLGNNITNRVLFSLIYQGMFAVSSKMSLSPFSAPIIRCLLTTGSTPIILTAMPDFLMARR